MIAKKVLPRPECRLLLDNIRSVHNVGSIFRTADTLGISHIYSIGTTPVPVDRFGRTRKDFAKVSLGAEDSVTWTHVPGEDAMDLIKKLKKEGFQIVALEQSLGSVDYKTLEVGPRTLVILGNEVDGVAADLLRVSNVIAEIPLKGKKESLNVSVAAAVFLYRLLNQ